MKNLILISIVFILADWVQAGPREEELMQAVRFNDFRRMKMLVRHGVDVDYIDEQGECPLSIALKKDFKNIAYFLSIRGAKARSEIYEKGPNENNKEYRHWKDKQDCLNSIVWIEEKLQYYLDNHGYVPQLSDLSCYFPGMALPVCPCKGKYSIKHDSINGYYIKCSCHSGIKPVQ